MIRCAIVGCGHIARKHIEAIRNTEGAELVALCDTDMSRLNEFELSIRVPVFTEMAEMLQMLPEIDLICICTPSGIHARLAEQAARAGKHLIIEKPVSLTAEDGETIRQAVRYSGVKAAVVHPNRYRPAVRYLKWALDGGLLGKISHVNATVRWNRPQAYYDQAPWRGTRAMDGGVLMNQAIHSLDLLLWMFGPAARVQALADTRLRRIETEDVAVAALRFESGVLGVVEAATTVYEHNLEESISVFGENGYVVIGGATANWIKHWKCSSMTPGEIDRVIQRVEQDPYGIPGHQRIIEDMVNAIKDDRDPAVTVDDGIRAVQLVHDIIASAEREEIHT
ncbi:Gfo/Idh/MocA family protein [Paenibacillus tuaregi]|uniref:Gfo/Idh/MocA family protein n=1 Tax=Paenibacillus tuaregi TaxID=1816681 RepID=UPI0008389033|nr:Gfo/Idh/MocA family oxidoreductase [Paenibacillus tuaregi]